MLIKHLDDLLHTSKNGKGVRLVVACAEDIDILHAVISATQKNIISPILIGNKRIIDDALQECRKTDSPIEIINQPDKDRAIE